MIKLPHRLKIIADLINNNCVVADIGTDHALLPIYLIQSGKASFVYAIDNKVGPLKIARVNVQKAKCFEKIKLIHSSGLSAINKVVDNVIISGLGTGTIMMILKDDSLLVKRYLLLPHNDFNYQIRTWVQQQNFFIENEIIVKDHDHFYELIVINKQKGYQVKTEIDLWFGPVLSFKKNNLFIYKWTQRQIYLKNMLQKTNIKQEQIELWTKELNLINKVLLLK